MYGKRKRKARRKAPLTILTLVLLAAGLSIILVPALLRDMQLNHEMQEYVALVEQAKSANTAQPLDMEDSPMSTASPQTGETIPPVGVLLPGETASAHETTPEVSETERPPQETALPSVRPPSAGGTTTGSSGQSATPALQPEEGPTATPVGNTGADLAACKVTNGDFVAWLQIPGTKIDYPVVLTNDIDHYLNHTFTGTESSLGTLFSLGKTDYQTPGRNIAIYGHHIRSSGGQKMFRPLASYKKQSFYAGHETIYLDTLYHTSIYTIFAVIDMRSGEWDASVSSFASEQSFLDFISRAKALSLYDTGVEVSAGDRVLTLITCDRDFGGADGRLVVMAVER